MDWDHTEIKAARVRAKKSQQDVADHLGVTRGAVAQWESGQTRPSLEKLQKLQSFIGLDVLHLLGRLFQSRPKEHAQLVRQVATAAQILQVVHAIIEPRLGIRITPTQAMQWLVKEAGLEREVFEPDAPVSERQFSSAMES